MFWILASGKMSTGDPNSWAPLAVSVYHILLSLADQERHGYGIMKEIETLTNGKVRLRAGVLYGNIKRLVEAGLIEKSEERPDPEFDDERRRYYRLTNRGRRVAVAETKGLGELISMARQKKLVGSPKMTIFLEESAL